MSTTGLDVFDTTLQKTQLWLKEIVAEMHWEQNTSWAYLALRTVLHAVRDHLPIEEATDLGAQLPMLIRGFYYEGWTLTGKPLKDRHADEFFVSIAQAFREDSRINPENVTRAVFRVLSRHITAGERGDVVQNLPAPLRALWPQEPQT